MPRQILLPTELMTTLADPETGANTEEIEGVNGDTLVHGRKKKNIGGYMLDYVDSAISLSTLIWLFPITFMLHDFEEIIWIEPWFRKNYLKINRRIPRPFQKKADELSKTTSSQFAFAVLIEFILFIPVTVYAAESGRYLFFLGFNLMLLLHVLIHLSQAVFLKKLTPGVTSGVLITLPYTTYLIYRLSSGQIVNWNDIFMSIPFGMILIPTVMFGHYIGKKIIRNDL